MSQHWQIVQDQGSNCHQQTFELLLFYECDPNPRNVIFGGNKAKTPIDGTEVRSVRVGDQLWRGERLTGWWGPQWGSAGGLRLTNHPWILNRREDERPPTRVCARRDGHAWFMLMGPLVCACWAAVTCLCATPRGLVGTRACVGTGVFVLFSALSDVRLTDSIHSADTARCMTISLASPESVRECVSVYVCVCTRNGCLTPPLISATPACLFSQPEPRPRYQRHSAQGGVFRLWWHPHAHTSDHRPSNTG